MENLGSTADFIVSAMLAVSQLIEPVPVSVIPAAEKAIVDRRSCEKFAASTRQYEAKACAQAKKDFQKYASVCAPIEKEMKESEADCATDRYASRVLRFKPKRIDEYLKFSNKALVEELRIICFAAQDRALLQPQEWQAGQLSSRRDLATKVSTLEEGGLQDFMARLLKEAADGQFTAEAAHQTATILCDWTVDPKDAGEQIDFTSAYKLLQELLSELPDIDHLPELPQANFVFDRNGHRIGEVYEQDFIQRNGRKYLGNLSRRRTVEPSQIPRRLFNAFIAVEDKRFREHNGFDFASVERLVSKPKSTDVQGGSTFTMQLIKNAFFMTDVEAERAVKRRTLRRKIKELLMIPKVERRYSKDEILTYYLNLISLTPNAQGVLMAAMDLFGKDKLSELTTSQMALLAALPKGTTIYNPRRYPDAAKARRNVVLDLMAEQEDPDIPKDDRLRMKSVPPMITAEERDTAKAEDLSLVPPMYLDQARIFSYFLTGHITKESLPELKKKNHRDPRWKMGGLDIKTSYDLELQKIVTNQAQWHSLNYERSNGRYKWTPWLDPTTTKNMNVAHKMAKPNADILDVFESLKVDHPYPETNWTIALKVPNSNQWLLEDGQTRVPVAGSDLNEFRKLKNFDAVTLGKEKNVYKLAGPSNVQAAAVVLDVETGEVLAITGGFSAGPRGVVAQKLRSNSKRWPGSAMKPFTYLYALNSGLQPNDIVRGNPVHFPRYGRQEGEVCPFVHSPGNYGGSGGGALTMRDALHKSVNLNVLNMFGILTGLPKGIVASGNYTSLNDDQKEQLRAKLFNVYDFLATLNVYPRRTELTEKQLNNICTPFLLGGNETSPLHMAQGYAALANGGLKRDALFLRQVYKDDVPIMNDQTIDLRNKVREYRAAVKQGIAVAPEAFGAIAGITPQSVAQLRSMMQGVLARGTAARIAEWAPLIAGKTGTTNKSRDVWFAGFTNKIAVVIWVGYDNDENSKYDDLGSATGGRLALPLFKSIMEGYFSLHPDAAKDLMPAPTEIPGVIRTDVFGKPRPLACGEPPSLTADEFYLTGPRVAAVQNNPCSKRN